MIEVPPTTMTAGGLEEDVVCGGTALIIIAPPVPADITSPEIVIAEPGVRVWEPKMKFEEPSREMVWEP